MTDLTEQWKKGELPSGEYYIIDDLGLHTTDKYYPSHGFGTELPQSVLGRVPSYEEMQNINKSVNNLMAANIKLQEENTKLKELLKECKKILCESQTTNPIVYFRWENDLINKIDEVLK